MSKVTVSDQSYEFVRVIPSSGELGLVSSKQDDSMRDVDAFLNRAMVCKIPVEVINLKPGELASLPKSVYGKTTVNFAGNAPFASLEHDKFDNMQLCMPEHCALEVIFNSEKVGAAGKNRGAHGRKIIYLVP